jgi:2-polyprenyl-3-methyl-5-hydroxy-6-metoxy-1,4-benzoquinol methylase
MEKTKRIPTELFADGHYLGRPADFDDRIVQRRIRLVREIRDFCGRDFSLLDIGCGNGASLFALAPAMKECTGIDIEPIHRPAFERHKAAHALTNCRFVVHDIERGGLDEMYDRIISFEVIEHLRDETSVRRYFDQLGPGGILAVSVPNKWWVFETHGTKLPLLPWNRVPFLSWLPRPVHERIAGARIYTKRRIVRLLERAGFTVTHASYVTAPLDVLPEGRVKRFLVSHVLTNDTTKVPLVATAIFVVARKPG